MADVDSSNNAIDFFSRADRDAEKGSSTPDSSANKVEDGPIMVEFEPGDPENPRNWSPLSEAGEVSAR